MRSYEGYVLDVDGVLVRGGETIPGAAEAVAALQERANVVVLTNNSTRSRQGLSTRLAAGGIDVARDRIVTSASVAATWILAHHGRRRVAVLGEEGLQEELSDQGHTVVSLGEDAEWLVVGMDRGLSYDRVAEATMTLRRGARLLATNDDATFPTLKGPVPGAGAVVGALRGAGYDPERVVGKPNEDAFDEALRVLGEKRADVLAVGDRLETDVAGALRARVDIALVLTGIAEEPGAETVPLPTWIAHDIRAVARGDMRPVGGGGG